MGSADVRSGGPDQRGRSGRRRMAQRGVTADGTVAAWGYNEDGEINVPAGLTNVVAVAAGFYHSLAVRADGNCRSLGRQHKRATKRTGRSDYAVTAAAGGGHSLALRATGP